MPKFSVLVATVLSHLVFPQLTNAFLPCPENTGQVMAQDGADGHYHLAGDFLLTNQSISREGGGSNITVTFTLKSAFDSSSFACLGQLISSDTSPNEDLTGNCISEEKNPAIGEAPTTFTYGLGDSLFKIDQVIQCIWNNTTRPRRVFQTTGSSYEPVNLNLTCSDSNHSRCTLDYDPKLPMPYCPIVSAAPLTDCADRSAQPPSSWTITNITYFDLTISRCIDCVPLPSSGEAFIDLYMAPIDYYMRCSPQGGDLGARAATGSTEWHRCDTSFDYGNAPDTPQTWVRFDQFTWEVALRQEWSCTGADGVMARYSGIGTAPTSANTTVPPFACDTGIDDISKTTGNLECWAREARVIHPTVTAS